MPSRLPASRLATALALAAASCGKPQVLLTVHRQDPTHQLSLLACDTCGFRAVFEDGSSELQRTVGLYFDGDGSRTLVLRLQRTGVGSACSQLALPYHGQPLELSVELPAEVGSPAQCTDDVCPTPSACGVRLLADGCDASTCPSGCCDAEGACWQTRADTACGHDGQACKDCTPSGTCLPQDLCSQDCLTESKSCDVDNPCCSGLVCHRTVCVKAASRGEACSDAVPCESTALTCRSAGSGSYCGLAACVAAGGGCGPGDACCEGAGTCSGGICCLALGKSCGADSDCCGAAAGQASCWNGCNPSSWVDGCWGMTCQSAYYCAGNYQDCDPDSNDCCPPNRCYNAGTSSYPDYECWPSDP